MTAGTSLTDFLDRAGQLYSLPAVALEVLELTSQPKVDVPALKRCIENDPALTAKILRVVNSSLFGLSREVSDLNQALALLGTTPLKLLVLGFSLSQAVNKERMGQAMERYWRRTLTRAVAAREVAARVFRSPGDEPFIAALLQDLGELVLLQELGEPYAQLLSRVAAREASLAEVEQRVLGFDHCTLTTELLERWHLPTAIISAINVASSAERISALPNSEQRLPRIVHSANLLVELLVEGRDTALTPLVQSLSTQTRSVEPVLRELVAGLNEKVTQLADVFAVQLPAGSDHRDILVRAQQQLAGVAAQVASDLLREKVDPTEASLWEEAQQASQAMQSFLRTDRRSIASSAAKSAETPEAAKPVTGSTATVAVAAKPKPTTTDHGQELLKRLTAAVATCRQERHSLTLTLVEVDGFERVADATGPVEAERLIGSLGRTCAQFDGQVLHASAAQFALIWPDCDRSQAARQAGELLRKATDHLGASYEELIGAVTVSIGVATVSMPPKNFPPRELADSAARCLSTAQLSGGNTVKSIAVF